MTAADVAAVGMNRNNAVWIHGLKKYYLPGASSLDWLMVKAVSQEKRALIDGPQCIIKRSYNIKFNIKTL